MYFYIYIYIYILVYMFVFYITLHSFDDHSLLILGPPKTSAGELYFWGCIPSRNATGK